MSIRHRFLSSAIFRRPEADPPGAVVPVKLDEIDAAVAQATADLAAMIADFDKRKTPYVPTRRAQFRYDYDDYAHLARIDEWAGDLSDGDGP